MPLAINIPLQIFLLVFVSDPSTRWIIALFYIALDILLIMMLVFTITEENRHKKFMEYSNKILEFIKNKEKNG